MTTTGNDRLTVVHASMPRAAREEFARAEEARGRDAVIGLQNACGKGWLSALEAAHALLSVAAAYRRLSCPLPTGAGGSSSGRHMDQDMKREFNEMRLTFHDDGYYGGIVDFDDMPRHLDELDEFIETVAEWPESLTESLPICDHYLPRHGRGQLVQAGPHLHRPRVPRRYQPAAGRQFRQFGAPPCRGRRHRHPQVRRRAAVPRPPGPHVRDRLHPVRPGNFQ